jgi:hypothetical protein
MDRVTVVPIVTSLEGQTLAAYVARGEKNQTFDGQKLSLEGEFFVYRTVDGKRLAVVPGTGADCALSPDGNKVVTFDGKDLRVFRLNVAQNH